MIVLRALAWLPLCLALWYLAADAFAWLPAKLAAPAIGQVERSEVARRSVAYSLKVEGPYRPGGVDIAEAGVEVPAATYTFGIAIFAALALAAGGWRHPGRVALGFTVLLPLPAIGIAFDALRQLGADASLAPLLAWSAGTREAITLGYQAGSLLLPTLAPIIAWLALFPSAWRRVPLLSMPPRRME